jgi:hypothetical protein
MLERTGLLRELPARAPSAPPADPAPARAGSRTISYPHPDGGQVTPSVTVDERGDLRFLLDPERDLRVALVQDGGRWRARVGDTPVSGDYSGPRSAKRALRAPLRDRPHGQWAVALLDKLFEESFQL